MNSSSNSGREIRIDPGIVCRQIDDLCFVHCDERSVESLRTRQMGEKLANFIERAQCRKLVMSFEGVECIYGFLLDEPHAPAGVRIHRDPPQLDSSTRSCSEMWVG
jgi:hypothetical protein